MRLFASSDKWIHIDIVERLRALAHLGCVNSGRVLRLGRQSIWMLLGRLIGVIKLRAGTCRDTRPARYRYSSLLSQLLPRMRTSSALRDPNTILLPLTLAFRTWDRLIQKYLLRFQISQLWSGHLRSLERIVLEKTLFNATIGKLHPTDTILDSFVPLSFVTGAIFPVHLTVAMPLIVLIAPLIIITRFPSEHAHTIFLIVLVGAFVHVAVLVIKALFPFTFAIFKTVFEFSDIYASVFPFILTLSFRFSISVSARIAVSIGENVRTLAMF